MQLPFKYDDLLNDDFGLETKSTSVREVKKEKIERDNTTAQSIEDTLNSMVDWSASEYFSDDIWNSFFEDSGMFSQTFFDDIETELDLGNTYDSLFAETIPYYHAHWSGPPINKDVLIKSHDCMWAGHCGSNEHKDDCDKALHKLWAGFINPPKIPTVAAPAPSSSQQSLLKPSLRNAGIPVINMITPQTPPMSDDEDKNINKIKVECGESSDLDEADQDLREYFNSNPNNFGVPQTNVEEEQYESSTEESESEEESHNIAGPSRVMSNVTSVRSNIQATQNDHSYFKDKNSSMIMSDLGIDTPSDSGGSTPPRCESVKSASEEEIDVVSVPDKKYPLASRMGYIPPTNPPLRGRRNMQRTLDSAMMNGLRNNNNNNNTNNRNGVKIMLPAKRAPSAINYPPAKRRAVAPANENNKGRRTRQTRTNMTAGRRRSNNSQEYHGQPDLGKRDIHNNMERQRREDLRDAFDDLRRLVPEVLRKDRAAKVVILREAAKYCNYLTNMGRSMKQHKRDLKAYQRKLKRKVSYLRTQAAIENGRIGEDGDNEEDEDYEEDEDEMEED